ncbi:MAG: PspC domain-containing protein [Dermatophilaceae bacterium]
MTTTAHTPTSTGLDRFFETLHRRMFVRSADGRIAGICAALAQRLGVAPKVVRIAAIVLAILGPGLGAYLALWLISPDTRGRLPLERALRGGEGKAIALTIVTALVVIADLDIHLRFGWVALVAIAIAYFGFGVGRRGAAGGHHRPAPPAMPYAAPPAPGSTTPGASTPMPHTPYGPTSPQDAPRW